MPTRKMHATAPATRAEGDARVTVVPRPDNVPIALTDGHGDSACGHCDLALLRGELAGQCEEDRVIEAGGRDLLVRCPACGWDNAVPRR